MTCSFGLAQYTEGDTPETLIARADSALYRAKLNGRKPWFWFVLSLVISPLGGSLALWAYNRYRVYR